MHAKLNYLRKNIERNAFDKTTGALFVVFRAAARQQIRRQSADYYLIFCPSSPRQKTKKKQHNTTLKKRKSKIEKIRKCGQFFWQTQSENEIDFAKH